MCILQGDSSLDTILHESVCVLDVCMFKLKIPINISSSLEECNTITLGHVCK